MALPDNLIANTLNAKGRREHRGFIDNDTIPRLHVSSLIKSSKQDFFCPREFVLRHMERRENEGGGIPPKFALLYAVGHFYGDYIVKEFMRRNPDYAHMVYGDWTCRCRQSITRRERLPRDLNCESCGGPLDTYVETDLFNPAKTVVGHSDMILLDDDDEFHVYEFKSMERADVPFDTLSEPLGDHLLQASNYYYMLKGEGKRVNPMIRFVYVDRSMTDLYKAIPFKEFKAKRIPAKRLANIYLRAKKCHTSIEKGILPERKCETITCGRAKQCTVATSCFARRQQKIKRIPLSAVTRSG